jgi:hypothetical protein
VKLRHLYLLLCLIGIIVPWWQGFPWVVEHGINIPLALQELFANRVAAAFGLDLTVSIVVAVVFFIVDGRRFRVGHVWLPVIGAIMIGLSFALPLFLYQRQLQIDRQQP